MKRFLVSALILVSVCRFSLGQETTLTHSSDSTANRSEIQIRKTSPLENSFEISAEDFNKGIVLTPLQLIQGRIPGFIVNNRSGNDPNPVIEIQARGISTLFLNTEPLYIVDGMPVKNVDFVIPETIESIQVLKSLAETAPYGIQGANGVVLINTKKEETRKFSLTYSSYAYLEPFYGESEFLSASEWLELKEVWAKSEYEDVRDISQGMIDYGSETDWINEISQNKLSQSHNLNASGRIGKTSYMANINYAGHNGKIQKTGKETFSGQLALSQLALKDKLQIDLSVLTTSNQYSRINYSQYHTLSGTNQSIQNIVSIANSYNPTVPVYNYDGTFGRDTLSDLYVNNPVQRLVNTEDNSKTLNMLANVRISYELLKGLNISTVLSVHKDTSITVNSYQYPRPDRTYKNIDDVNNGTKERLNSLNANYSTSFGNHHLNLDIGYSFQKKYVSYSWFDTVYIDDRLDYSNHPEDNYDYYIKQLSGFFKYDYDNRYYLSFEILQERTDLIYGFEDPRFFPSVSAGWSLRNEAFMQNLDWLNKLTLRVSYGKSQRIIDYRTDLYDKQFYVLLPSNYDQRESMNEAGAGIDISMITNRVFLSADYYQRETDDGISIISSDLGGRTFVNHDNKILNQGFELYIKAMPLIRVVNWSFEFNFAFNKNTILNEIHLDNGVVIMEGDPVGNFQGCLFAGFSETGEPLVLNESGDPTNDFYPLYDDNYIGNGVPKSTFGFSNNFGYKNFYLSVFMRGATGFDLSNQSLWRNYYTERSVRNSNSNLYDSAISADQREIMNAYMLRYTDYAIEKGDYLKIENITMGYNIPFKKSLFTSANIYVSCDNVAILTGFSNGDPESAGTTGIQPGYYYYDRYPNTRLFALGFKITL